MHLDNFIFSCILIFALSLFSFNLWKIVRNIRLGKAKNRFDQPLKRTIILLKVAFGQTKLFARPVSGILHALVYWGFLVITKGSIKIKYAIHHHFHCTYGNDQKSPINNRMQYPRNWASK